ncbi:MAG: DUF4197 domain-containing protein [Desulfobacterales bacterium]|jgi:hypothetical protein
MKIYRYVAGLVMIALLIVSFHSGFAAGLSDMVKDAQKALGGSAGGLSNDEITAGLKEALQVGTEKAVGLVSQPDGFYQNPAIKIPLPESVQKVEKLLRTAGYGEKVDAFELSMNRAAERAAPEAKSIFWDAISDMNFDDAKKILNGSDNEATLYFQDKTSERLQEVFKPIVKDAMGEVGVTRSYQDLNNKITSLPFGKSASFDLDQYVTDGALKGLFKMLAEQEKLIRTQPAARVTDLLQKVFAAQ